MMAAIIEPTYFAHINKEELKFFSVSSTPSIDHNVKNITISEQAAIQFLHGHEQMDKWYVTYDKDTEEYDIVRSVEDEFNYLRIQLQDNIKLKEQSVITDLDIRVKLNSANDTIEIYFKDFVINTYPEVKFTFTKDGNPFYYKGFYILSKHAVDTLKAKNLSINPIIISVEDVSDLSIYTKMRNINIAISK